MKLSIVVSSLVFITACENQSNNSQLVDLWATESCEQVIATNGAETDQWQTALYKFTNQDEILVGRETYNDSNCIAIVETVLPSELTTSNTVLTVSYKDQGSAQLEEGLKGNALQITMTSSSDDSLSLDAFYIYRNDKLCFSEAFTFDVFDFGISEIGSDAINFNQCLTKF